MIHIAYCFDKNYQQHFGASLTSLLLNFGGDGADLHIHVITDEADRTFNEKLEGLMRMFKARIELHPLSREEVSRVAGLPARTAALAYMVQATWYRVLIANILPPDVPRALYLDADTIVLSDIGELFKVDMKGAPMAGVQDYSGTHMAAKYQLKHYVNSGVLLMDLQQWRAKDHVAACLEHAAKHNNEHIFPDQCALNTFFGNDIHLLERKWNRYVTAHDKPQDHPEDGILHFITADKPWHEWHENPLAKLYWKYLDVSPWAGAAPIRPQSIDKARRLARLRYAEGKHPESVHIYENMLESLLRGKSDPRSGT